ncbi:Ig-like domain-containing protein [Clostridium botulinum]|uniref:Putative lipoprotein n=1 Tax=Clostridium botulinum (strain Langeland / NCTC 10281 / Type F) TaxID=441772 RepID=A7GB09_CLOBL|nr:Ig-like domain-containing protein [Clostridium botulinum]ABS42754.1 putative lipoprotein [Clostridium botulinum F str. Langeland]ADF98431.1 putative lipoprotein [Clostridium botulinum F str. 230613]KKM40278.1 hypothetical protein VT72_18490 [Clostridium botulinum]MBY6793432.1 Ig-like domain-containing protein [Clostridium botulinum]MBY6939002.1 Ig-like domain-containing protein [Clostridium botulinum]
MRKKAIISLLLILITMLGISGCGKKEKTSVLTNNVKQQEAMKENEVKKFIKNGTNFLNAGKYDDAKSSFEKAILMEKSNKGSYIEIKNKCMEKNRLDDAYYFIKLAVNNNVDAENMEKILSDIKSRFQVTKLYVNVYQNNEYKLPDKIKVKINNEDKEVGVIWNNDADTSEIGTIKYQGKIEQYDRCAELYLKVLESPKERQENNDKEVKGDKNMNNSKKEDKDQNMNNSKKEDKDQNLKEVKDGKQIGFINEIYERNGKRYLKFDDVEFFHNKDINDRTAEREAIKDGKNEWLLDGRMTDDYYLRNKDNTLENYEMSQSVEIDICKYHVDENVNTIDLQGISYEKFKTLDNVYGQSNALFYIYVENNVIVKIEEQYRP